VALVRVYCGLVTAYPPRQLAVGSPSLYVTIVDDSGRMLDVCEIGDDSYGYAYLSSLLAERATGPYSVAIATNGGQRLVPMLLATAGWALAVIDDEATDDYAERFADEFQDDAASTPTQRRALGLARALQGGALSAALQPAPPELAELKPVLAALGALATGRHATSLALREVLRELYPAALRAYPDPADPVALAVMDALPEPGTLGSTASGRSRDAAAAADAVAGRLAAAGLADQAAITEAITALRVAIAETPRRSGISRSLTATVAETVRQSVAAVRAYDVASTALVKALADRVAPPRHAAPSSAIPAPSVPASVAPAPAAAAPASASAPASSSPRPTAIPRTTRVPAMASGAAAAPSPGRPPMSMPTPVPPLRSVAASAAPPSHASVPSAPPSHASLPAPPSHASVPGAPTGSPPPLPPPPQPMMSPPPPPQPMMSPPAAPHPTSPPPVAPAPLSPPVRTAPANRPVSPPPPPPPGITPITETRAPLPTRTPGHSVDQVRVPVPRPTLEGPPRGSRSDWPTRSPDAPTEIAANGPARDDWTAPQPPPLPSRAGREPAPNGAPRPTSVIPPWRSDDLKPPEPPTLRLVEPTLPDELRDDLGYSSSRSDPSRSDPLRSDPLRSDPSRSDPLRSDPLRSDPLRSDPLRSEPSRSGPSRSEPSRSEPSRSEPSRSDPLRSDPLGSDSYRSDQYRSDQYRSDQYRSDPYPSDQYRSDAPTSRLDSFRSDQFRSDFRSDPLRSDSRPLRLVEPSRNGVPLSVPPVSADDDDTLLIFAETRSAWFDKNDEATWGSAMDLGWRAAEQASRPTVGDRTDAGLPRRVPHANLVPGAPPRRDDRPLRVVRDAASIAENTNGYFSGWRRGQEVGGYPLGGRQRQQPSGGAWEFHRDEDRLSG
jgi:hypothetical protein